MKLDASAPSVFYTSSYLLWLINASQEKNERPKNKFKVANEPKRYITSVKPRIANMLIVTSARLIAAPLIGMGAKTLRFQYD